jgi:hypothetical protein
MMFFFKSFFIAVVNRKEPDLASAPGGNLIAAPRFRLHNKGYLLHFLVDYDCLHRLLLSFFLRDT